MKTIAFYSYKGGVGRTLALSNIARRLADFGKKVIMLDLDLEAPGLHTKFSNFQWDRKVESGIVDYIYEYAVNHKIPAKITSYAYHLEDLSSSLDLIPAGNPKSSEYWRKLSAINWYELLYGENATGIAFFLDLKVKIEKKYKPDYFLIDTRTGITDISSLTISLLADRLVILSANNQENLEGCQRIVRSVLNQKNNMLEKEKEIILALTRIPYPSTPTECLREESLIANFKKHFEGLTYASGKELNSTPVVIHSDRDLECSETFKIGFEKETKGPSEIIANEYLDLFARITAGDLTKEEIEKFDNEKEIARLYNKISQTENAIEGVQLAEETIKKYPKADQFYYLLALKCLKAEMEEKGIRAINQAIKLLPLPYYLILKAGLLYNKGEREEAYKVILPIRHISPQAFYQYCLAKVTIGGFPENEVLQDLNELKEMNYLSPEVDNLIACYQNEIGNYKEAEKAIYSAIEQDKNRPVFYTTLAEIKANQNDIPLFYMNIDMALSKGADIKNAISTVPRVYSKFKNDEKFISLLKRYGKEEEIELLKTL